MVETTILDSSLLIAEFRPMAVTVEAGMLASMVLEKGVSDSIDESQVFDDLDSVLDTVIEDETIGTAALEDADDAEDEVKMLELNFVLSLTDDDHCAESVEDAS